MTGKRSGMTEEKIILSLSGLTRQSRDPRNALRLSEDDLKEGSTGICKGDVRLKPEYDREAFGDDRRKNNTVIVGLDPTIQRSPERAALVRG